MPAAPHPAEIRNTTSPAAARPAMSSDFSLRRGSAVPLRFAPHARRLQHPSPSQNTCRLFRTCTAWLSFLPPDVTLAMRLMKAEEARTAGAGCGMLPPLGRWGAATRLPTPIACLFACPRSRPVLPTLCAPQPGPPVLPSSEFGSVAAPAHGAQRATRPPPWTARAAVACRR